MHVLQLHRRAHQVHLTGLEQRQPLPSTAGGVDLPTLLLELGVEESGQIWIALDQQDTPADARAIGRRGSLLRLFAHRSQSKEEPSAATILALRPQVTTHLSGDRAADGEPQTRPRVPARLGRFKLPELVENGFQLPGRDPRALVGDLQHGLLALPPPAHSNRGLAPART